MLEKHHIIQEIPMDISEIIQSHYDSLTKKQRLIADYILENPMEVCYISLSDLSGKTGCSELTVLKFCKALGFTGFIDLKKAFRTCHERMDVLDGSFSRPDEADECSDLRFLQKQCDSQMKNISRFYAQVNLDEVSNIAQALTSRRILYVFAHDTARIFASYLCERLLAMEFTVVPVNLSDTQQIEKAFNNMDQKDAAILFSFPNYFSQSGQSPASRRKSAAESSCLPMNPIAPPPPTRCIPWYVRRKRSFSTIFGVPPSPISVY
jgi:DNA-binding MurR/RpiR family transcriptional regulator